MKFSLYFSLIVSFFIIGCASNKNTTSTETNSIFSKGETKLILSGATDESMRVLLITNPKDSIILRSKSQDFIVNKNDKLLQTFTNRLYQTVRDSASRGVGIAAPQVGILKKIIWIQRFDKENEPFEVYYNPRITKYSDLKQDVLEGCLSIPDIRETTHDRSYAVLLEYDNRTGQHKCEMIEAFTAVIFQHEIDHLNGILFTDHLEQEVKESIKHKIE